MSMHTVTFLPHNKKVSVNDSDVLIRAAMEAGVHINASCGGEGVCGKCGNLCGKVFGRHTNAFAKAIGGV
ncbi:MAG: 2Fe-2S iron-sulfur cluster binding domain-containing protein, partial [Proteobacteria bacterium]|nr:2Fe-2S iron-sulfur cluster binding domain-containing protein [Pseudomonadota bacterium]